MSVNGKTNTIKFNSKFVKFCTENAYNNVIIAENIENMDSDIIVTSSVFQTPEFAQKSFCGTTIDNDEVVNILTISVNGSSQTLFKTLSLMDISYLDDGIEIITEEHPDYSHYFSMAFNIFKSDTMQFKKDLSELSEKSRQDEQLFAMGNAENIESSGSIQILALSSVGTEVRNIINNAGLSWWWTAPGFGFEEIKSSQRILTMDTTVHPLNPNIYYSDCLIWEYVNGSVSSGSTNHTAYLQLKILYNIRISYNTSNNSWDDWGINSTALALRNCSVGIKTAGYGNNDFSWKIEQDGSYAGVSGGSSTSQNILKKTFFKVIPYGSYVSDAIDLLGSFVNIAPHSTWTNGMGTTLYSDDPTMHQNQNNGFIRSTLLKSEQYCLQFNNHFQQQQINIIKRPRSGTICEDKKFTYQSHFEVVGDRGSGPISIHTNSISYVKTYS